MKLARVILFTGQMEAMSEFYGKVLGLKQVTQEKGWKSLPRAAQQLPCTPAPPHRVARAQRSYSTLPTSPLCVKPWLRVARNSGRSGRASSFAFAMAKTRMAIQSSSLTAEHPGR